ncbi:hypothetical protein [Agromyces archimandritae]|uniref:IclR-ED domain-containing protein n=1 Tax=Agromyces archimandritae TaxID=2781962 RepID=A0A975FQK1_9MICO|nr:hypothetical protein [Agromyces archimandritae]QTX06002.1 hypothetical protein G127AT_07430 [Agromyces archimandritae]
MEVDAHVVCFLFGLRPTLGATFRIREQHSDIRLLSLSRRVGIEVRGIAKPILGRFAEELRCTAILNVVDGEEVVCLVSVEPTSSGVRVAHREGQRHALSRGASGIAAAAALPHRPGERRAVTAARHVGYAVSHAEVAPGTVAASAPLSLASHDWTGAVSLLFADALAPTPADAGRAVKEAARLIGEAAA